MFTEAERDQLRARLLDRARADRSLMGAAITGSAALGDADRWSDIDLFFGVVEGLTSEDVLNEWSQFMYQELDALHHFDVRAAPAIYRAFLLPSCLEVDLAFAPAAAFGARRPHFRAIFGEPRAQPDIPRASRDHRIGLTWHHALHARVCIERGKVWQAEYWISAIRDEALALACLRFGRPTDYAKGADTLPPELTAPWEGALVRALMPSELRRALGVAIAALLDELREADAALTARLEEPLRELGAVPPPVAGPAREGKGE